MEDMNSRQTGRFALPWAGGKSARGLDALQDAGAKARQLNGCEASWKDAAAAWMPVHAAEGFIPKSELRKAEFTRIFPERRKTHFGLRMWANSMY